MNTEETTMKNIPTEIYLQVDAGGERPEDFQDLDFEFVSWCVDKIYPTDIKYTLADDEAPAIGGEGEVLQDRSEAKPETPGPEGYRPDNQLLPQETTTQNIKTPDLQEIKDQVAQEHDWLDWDEAVKFIPTYEIHHLVDKICHRYAQQLIEADRKDCAEKAVEIPLPRPFVGKLQMVSQDSILNRPLPKMQ